MVTYGFITETTNRNEDRVIEISEQKLKFLLKEMIETIEFDEEWYRRTYSDVADAVSDGIISSCHQHYIGSGYFENRFPRLILVDEKWYLQQYPDVQDGINDGRCHSAQHHFVTCGFREGRKPYSEWTLKGDSSSKNFRTFKKV